MNEVSKVLESVLSEFALEENSVEEKLNILRRSKRSELLNGHRPLVQLQFETLDDVTRAKENALKRNKTLRKDLNISMCKLRSKQCYNPAEDNLNQMLNKYSEILSRVDVD